MSNLTDPPAARRTVLLLGAAVLLAGCARLAPQVAPPPSEGTGLVITHDEIADSGARDAWEAIRRNVNHLRFSEDLDGDPVWIGAVRGNPSLVAPDALLLVVDETIMQSPGYLRNIPARTVAWIQILSGAQGTARYGPSGGHGVVVIRTQAPGRGIVHR